MFDGDRMRFDPPEKSNYYIHDIFLPASMDGHDLARIRVE